MNPKVRELLSPEVEWTTYLRVKCCIDLCGKNEKWGGGGNRYQTAKYKLFLKSMVLLLKSYRRRFSGHVDVDIWLTVSPWRDHHGCLEPILDALQQSNVIGNDKWVDRITMHKPTIHKRKESDEIVMIIEEAK